MRIGVLLLDHGEPPEYNANTYGSFRNFATSLIDMGFIPKMVLRFDRGTILQDRDACFTETASPHPSLVDAWLRPYDRTAHFIPPAKRLRLSRFGIYRKGTRSHYLAYKTGPGYGEPDFYEMYGFDVYGRWRLMGGRSPYYAQTLPQKQAVVDRLTTEYGARVVVKTAYGIDPFPHVANQTPQAVVKSLVRDERITHLVVSEHFAVTTDSMSTFHLRKHVEHALDDMGVHVPVIYAEQLGGTDAFNAGVVCKVRDELSALPTGSNVAVLLSNHGFPTTNIGRYDAANDCYHRNVKTVFASVKTAIEQAITWHGAFTIRQVFGQFLEKKYNPRLEMTSPLRALDHLHAQGYDYVVDIPYEFPGDSVDVLVKLRQAYGLTHLPNWNAHYETSLKYKDIVVKITSASFYPEHWIDAYHQRTVAAIETMIDTAASSGST
jgi:protoheme ferro-lyase